MHRWAAVILGSMLLATVQAAFFSALPTPASSIDLVLIVVVGLIASFQPRYAYAAAMSGGLARDAVSSAPPGLHMTIGLLTAFVLVLVFERVITNLSFVSFAALNAVGFTLYWVVLAFGHVIVDLTLGQPVGRSVSTGAASLLGGIIAQTSASLLLLLVVKNLGKYFRTRFFISEHA
jgi:hypothetical protein